MFTSLKSRVGVLALTATMGVGLVGMASPAGATGTNPKVDAIIKEVKARVDNAKRCQNNGWKTLGRADGTPFKSLGDCVLYAAKGGTFTPGPVCYRGQNFNDVKALTGPIDTLNNVTIYNSVDGTCTGGVSRLMTFVSAADQTAANAKCPPLTGFGAFAPAAAIWANPPTLPGNYWLCVS